MNDDFVGSVFSTPSGGKLTVVCISGLVGRHKKYGLVCSLCSEDKELYPKNFEMVKSNLVKGSIPCGCSKKPVYTQEQARVILTRLCVTKGYEFVGFPDGYKNTRSRFEYKCSEHGTVSSVYKDFVINDTGCPSCAKNKKITKQEMEEKLKNLCTSSGYEFVGFPDGYVNTKSKFEYICPYHGNIVVECNSFICGHRCKFCGVDNSSKKLINKSYDETIKSLCESYGYEFVGFPDGYKNAYSKFEFICKEHGNHITTYKSFVNHNTKCPGCSKSGYDPSKSGYFYIFKYKIVGLPLIYKFGITNRTPDERSYEHLMNIPKEEIEINENVLMRYYSNGRVPQNIESVIKSKYKGVSDWLTSGNTETIYEMDLSDVIDIVEGFL